ncbi:MAG: hypothetical protein ACFFDB_00710 [Promethearchaeota archaeon]
MINQVKDIEYIERKKQWFLWYINNVGDLDSLSFQTEIEAQDFRKGFQFIANSLYSDKEKFIFYEKTKLDNDLIREIIKFGNCIKFFKNTLESIGLRPEIILKTIK